MGDLVSRFGVAGLAFMVAGTVLVVVGLVGFVVDRRRSRAESPPEGTKP